MTCVELRKPEIVRLSPDFLNLCDTTWLLGEGVLWSRHSLCCLSCGEDSVQISMARHSYHVKRSSTHNENVQCTARHTGK